MFSPDGKFLFCAGGRGILGLVAENGNIFFEEKNREFSFDFISISPDGKILACANKDFIVLWDIEKKQVGKILGKKKNPALEAGSMKITGIQFSPDGKFLCSVGKKGKRGIVQFWDSHAGRVVNQIEDKLHFSHIAFSSDGKIAIFGNNNGYMLVWDMGKGRPLSRIGEEGFQLTSLVFLPGKELVVCGGEDGSIRIWDIRKQKEVGRFLDGDKASILCLGISGQTFASGSFDGLVRLWDTATRKENFRSSGHQSRVTALSFSSVDNKIVSADMESNCLLWEFPYNKKPSVLRTKKNQEGRFSYLASITSISFSKDGKSVLTVPHSGPILLWDLQSQKVLQRFIGKDDNAYRAARFTPDGLNIIAFPSSRGNPRIWDRKTGKIVIDNKLTETSIQDAHSFCFSPDGKNMVVSSKTPKKPRVISIFDTVTGKVKREIPGSVRDRCEAVVSFDSKYVASDATVRKICLWDIETGIKVKEFAGRANGGLVFSPKHSILAFAQDNEIHIVNYKTGQRFNPLVGHRGPITSLSFSHDGSFLSSGSWDTSILVWDLSFFTK